MKKILKEYPHIKILKKNATHSEILKKGIKCVLSVYGSVVYEYAYFGIPTILASKNHPYKNFSFVKEASSKREYKKLLKNVKKFKINFSKKEIFSYYYLRFLKSNNLFNNYDQIAKKLQYRMQSPLILKVDGGVKFVKHSKLLLNYKILFTQKIISSKRSINFLNFVSKLT